jgi:hypothetical protein
MRATSWLFLLVLTVGVYSCRHANTDSAATPSEGVSRVEPADPTVAIAEPAAPAVESTAPPPVPPPSASEPVELARVDFQRDVQPILEARCQPCHFPGGVMYERRPFDRAETITALGTKLFTRLKDADDQRIISEFLAQQSGAGP